MKNKIINYWLLFIIIGLFLFIPFVASATYGNLEKGDINDDGQVNLTDAILSLQVLALMNPSGIRADYASSGVDINNDNKIGIEEVIYIMQVMSGLRISASTGVIATSGNGQVTIAWTTVSSATSYNIYWSTTSGITKANGTQIPDATSPYTHTGRTNGTTYYYIVTAVNSSGESVESVQASATPMSPTGEGVWSSLGNGLEGPVNSLAFYNGNLCAASYGVYSWDGSTWTDMSNGMLALFGSGDVYALTNFSNDFFAGGFFTVLTPDGNWYNNVARFEDGGWTTCGSGTGYDGSGMDGSVNYLIEYNGQLYAGGNFGSAGGDPLYPQTATFIACFYEGQWHPVGGVGGGMNDTVTDMVVYNGELIVSGYFNKADWLTPTGEDYNPNPVLVNHIAKWNGVNWSPLGSGMDGKVTALAVYNGELYAGGLFENAGGVPAKNTAKWNGESWSPVGGGITEQVYTLASYNNELYAGGAFRTISGNAGNYIMCWDGNQWKSVGSGTDGPVITLLPDSSGLIVGGQFSTAGNVSANNIAKYSVTK